MSRMPGAPRWILAGSVTAFCWLAGAAASDLPPQWSSKNLVRYGASDEAKPPQKVRRRDGLDVYRDGALILRRYYLRHHPPKVRYHVLCLDRKEMRRLRRLLRRASRIGRGRSQPYPTRGAQGLLFGRDAQYEWSTSVDESLPPMRGRVRRKLFRHMETLRQRARDSTRKRPCPS